MRRLFRFVWLLLFLGLAGCESDDARPPNIPLRYASAIERRATLSTLRRAWDERPMSLTDDHKWYERRLLNRIGSFGKKTTRTETFTSASQFWLACLHEHQSRYDD